MTVAKTPAKTTVVAHNGQAVAAPAKPKLTTARVPDASLDRRYVHRDIHGVNDYDLLDGARDDMANVLLKGPTGPGKTFVTRAWAANRNALWYSLPCSTATDLAPFFGQWIQDPISKVWTWWDGPIPTLLKNGGLLLIDEINAMQPRISVGLHSLLDGRREIVLTDHGGEIVRAHTPPRRNSRGKALTACWCDDGVDCPPERAVVIVGTMNPDYEGTRPLSPAMNNRFPLQVWWGYDAKVEESLVRSAALRGLAVNMRQADTTDTPVSTNMLEEFERMYRRWGWEMAAGTFVERFTPDEQKGVKDALDKVKVQIEMELAVPEPNGYDDVFDTRNSGWLLDK